MYADLGAVQARMPQFQLTATSKPSQQDAETFMLDAEAQIDATLENIGYVVPITGEKALSIVKNLTIALTIASVLQARAASVGGDAAIASADRAQKWYDDKMRALSSPTNPLELTDAVRNTKEVVKPQHLTSGLLVDDDGEEIVPWMTMHKKF